VSRIVPDDLWDEIYEFIVDHVDIRDDSDGPLPNRAMSLQTRIDAEVKTLPSAIERTEPAAYIVEFRETLIDGRKKHVTMASLEPREPTIMADWTDKDVESRELLKVTPLFASTQSATGSLQK
jgi:hypothetical protein